MKYLTRAFFFLTLSTLIWVPLSSNAGAQTVSGEITHAGIFKSESTKKIESPETPTGYTVSATGMKLVKETDTIPAKLGVSFGFEYVLIGLDPNKPFQLKKVVSHPKFTKPDGSVTDGYETIITGRADAFGTIKDFSGYLFDQEYELQPGEWNFKLMYGNQKLVEKAFTVVKE